MAIVGAGAAGLTTAIFAKQLNPRRSVILLDGAKKPGAKILVSGGGRCNVTNAEVTERDFWGGRPAIVRKILRQFPVAETVRFFETLGIRLHEEQDGKLFPDSNRARDVLHALITEAERVGVRILPGHRVAGIHGADGRFRVTTNRDDVDAQCVVLATGGRSLPKSGSDGNGYDLARTLGHTIVPTTPALVPLVLDPSEPLHRALSGVAHDVEVAVWAENRQAIRLRGSLLWTHFGVSGPVVLNASRHWARARLLGLDVRVSLNLLPPLTFDAVERELIAASVSRPRATVPGLLASRLPTAVAGAVMNRLGLSPQKSAARLTRPERRRLVHALVDCELPVEETRGYTYAEATAGGVELTEIDPATMASRKCPGLYLVGELLDVDGRIGGFNFQWAWSSAHVAASALAAVR